MAESDIPFGAEPPDADQHRSVNAGTALLRVETTRSLDGVLDGAWWPRSRDIGAELPGLVSALTEFLGPVTRLGLDAEAWDELPARVVVDGRAVPIDSFPVGDDTVLITRGDQDHFALLVVPPHEAPGAAREAMSRAVRAGTPDRVGQILIDTGTGRAHPVAEDRRTDRKDRDPRP
ncbi:DUF5994 family protein [Streptomyces sp. NPDC048650]|uniref:DUF5994 family protein n=1 Tax=unclassified Streptomyces TaxID=2593676 RepID=UPI00371FCEAB